MASLWLEAQRQPDRTGTGSICSGAGTAASRVCWSARHWQARPRFLLPLPRAQWDKGRHLIQQKQLSLSAESRVLWFRRDPVNKNTINK